MEDRTISISVSSGDYSTFGIKKKGLYGFDFWYTNKIRILLTILGIIWLIGSVIWAFIYVRKIHQMHKMLQKGRKCQPEIIKKNSRFVMS